MKFKNFILFGFVFFILLSIVFNLISIVTYEYEMSNCNVILEYNDLATNDASIRCIRIINHPIHSYYFPEIVCGIIISFLITIVLFLFIALLYDIYFYGGFE